ncbi:DUF4870 domain-containing protein [Leucobacter allii]|uniref:DUF4870 domain-containing protein n=1 Tax=Leucobacter allii TaxID=2932247 RepID=A0ABY4FJ06_9MICO|nr:DUF4870 domain-containing protein [Leucobacter allii]UOQ56676.1 DUF4870 domain-containing protein [Leucobacter allii]
MTTLPPEGQDGQTPADQTPNVPAPEAPVPPAAPAAPETPQYQAPQQPAQPQYQAPPAAPQYQAPAGGQTPPPGGYQQPQPGYAQPVSDPVSNVTLNYWLSVFFTWIPALIFFLIEKDKGNRQAYDYHRDNLNFSLLRVAAVIAAYILMVIPYIGWVLAIIVWIGLAVLFVFHIIAAVKAPQSYRNGERPPFIFNIPLVK